MTNFNLYTDMLKQVHILIAGCAGSGKSVVINGMISEAICGTPEEAKLILIDPKRVELVEYKGLPHTLRYASEPDEMVAALQYAMNLCDARYTLMQAAGQKKYQGAHVYVIIDELADLMTTDKKRVMPLIQRLCQVGRAAGISVVAATQCPLTIVIPTPIKVNFDCVIGLHTVNAQHSRNIIDEAGCEKLPRYGKAIYTNPDMRETVNVPMVSDEERAAIINYWLRIEAAKKAPKPTAKAAPKAEHKPTAKRPEKRKGFFERLFA